MIAGTKRVQVKVNRKRNPKLSITISRNLSLIILAARLLRGVKGKRDVSSRLFNEFISL